MLQVRESINVVTAVESRNWANLSDVMRDDYHGAYFEVDYLPASMIARITNRCGEENRFTTKLDPY